MPAASKKTKSLGLTTSQAEKKFKQHGFNEIEKKEQLSWPSLLISQFKSPLIYILFIAGLITLFLKEWTDSVIIFLAVILNTVMGFIQEYKAEKSLAALREMLIPHAKVFRDGKEQLIEARLIVPGDMVILTTGDKVPAEGKLTEAVDLHINEAILTGESKPVSKTKKDEVYMGTVIISGRGKMEVTKTGNQTKMGKIATKLSQTVSEETPLKKQINKLSKVLTVVFGLICLVIFIEGLWRGREFIESFTLSVAVAVAAIPEGLVISLTVILTLGMQKVLQKKGLVRKLLAAETLGSVDVICADKTGTLTEGKMKVVGFASSKNFSQKQVIKAAALCNNMTNPLEISMMNWAISQSAGKQNIKALIDNNPRIDEIPFDSERKFIAVLTAPHSDGQGEILLSGAPEMVMAMSYLNDNEKKQWLKKLNDYTKKGLRVIAFSRVSGRLVQLKEDFHRLKIKLNKFDGKVDGDFKYLDLEWGGLLLFEDPVRTEVKTALKKCSKAGIKVKVITGDYRNTAVAVLNKLEIEGGNIKENSIMEGWELEKLSQDKLINLIDDIVLFARTTPEQKIRIVEALQAKGHSVAMMGDGVNDALALKKSDIGVVVGEASEVAKETADMVLLDSNFNTIVAAVEEGRGIFENIKKVVLYLLSDSFTEVVLISSSLFLGLPTPLLPAQILWVNLVEDGLPGIALAFEPKDDNLMTEPPRDKKEPILDNEIKTIIFIIGFVTDFLLLAIFLILLKINLSLSMIRTIIFAALAVDSLLYVFSCKTLRKNIWHENIFSNKFLILAVLVGLFLLLAGIYIPFFNILLKTKPLPLIAWLLIVGKGLTNVIGIEFIKWLYLKNKYKKN
jgi:P-type Ca2+ transporter type 2C